MPWCVSVVVNVIELVLGHVGRYSGCGALRSYRLTFMLSGLCGVDDIATIDV